MTARVTNDSWHIRNLQAMVVMQQQVWIPNLSNQPKGRYTLSS